MSGTRSPSSTPTGGLSSLSEVEHGRNSSPLNPNATPPNKTTALSPSANDNGKRQSSSPHIPISAISEGKPINLAMQAARQASSPSVPDFTAEEMRSTVRERSR